MTLDERMKQVMEQAEERRAKEHLVESMHTGETEKGWFAIAETDKGHVVWIKAKDIMYAAKEIMAGIEHDLP
jgi:hypothetical protein